MRFFVACAEASATDIDLAIFGDGVILHFFPLPGLGDFAPEILRRGAFEKEAQ